MNKLYKSTADGLVPMSPEEQSEFLASVTIGTIQVPQTITIRQARRVLLAAGLLDDVEAVVANTSREVQIDWEFATEVNRSWPVLVEMSKLIGLTEEQLDDLFIQGSML